MRCPACKLSRIRCAPLGRVGQGDCCPAKCRGCRPEPAQGGMAGIRVSLGGVQFPGGVEANFVQCRRCPSQVPRRATGFCSVCRFPDESRLTFGTTTPPGLVPAPIAFPTPSFSPCLPMWPSSRRPWPSSVGLRCCWDAEGSLWRTRLRESAERQVGGSEPTFTCGIWTLVL